MNKDEPHPEPAGLTELELLISQIGNVPEDEMVRRLLNFSETKGIDRDVYSLTIDAMLVAEHDDDGEFTSISELRDEVTRIKKGVHFQDPSIVTE